MMMMMMIMMTCCILNTIHECDTRGLKSRLADVFVVGRRLVVQLTTCCVLQCIELGKTTHVKQEEHSIEVHNSRRPLDRLTLTLTLTFDL